MSVFVDTRVFFKLNVIHIICFRLFSCRIYVENLAAHRTKMSSTLLIRRTVYRILSAANYEFLNSH